ncbi:unnamed protein product [Camellia sinensis]
MCVYFVDIKSLVQPSSLRGNVIHIYAVLLMEEQDRLVGVEFPDKSYIFSSICLYARYVHFPICFRAHWKLVVYDTEMGVWKHYNSIRPRAGIEDKHFKEAVFVRDTILEIQRGAMVGLGDDDATQIDEIGRT